MRSEQTWLIAILLLSMLGCSDGRSQKAVSITGSWYPNFGAPGERRNARPNASDGVLIFNANRTFELRQGSTISGRWQQSGRNITLEGFGDNYYVHAYTGQGAGAPNMNLFVANDGNSLVDTSNPDISFVRFRGKPK